jgi:Skp family chaperone for outer membrane proteins
VKSTAIILTGVVSLGLAIYCGTQLRAQPQQQYNGQVQQTIATAPVAPPRTKIAVVNLQSVIRQYVKSRDLEVQYKSMYDNYNKDFEGKKARAVQLKSELEKADASVRDQLEQQLRNLQREADDMAEQAKKTLGKLRDEQAVQIYSEIEEAVKAYARSQDIELVLHFNDAIAPADLHNPAVVERKMATVGCMPIYVTPGMDITNMIAAMLNQRLGMAPQGTQR